MQFSFGQSAEEYGKDLSDTGSSKLQAGIFLGACFANKYSAQLYDGYGYDENGVKNSFINYSNIEKSSFMYRSILLEYGGGNGQPDQIALALGVNHGDWTFDETDMPRQLKYNLAFTAGIQFTYSIQEKNVLFINANTCKLTASGNFSIIIITPPIGNQQPGYQNIQTFAITGSEQRTTLQMGYRRILGGDKGFNFFAEAGPSINMIKYLANSAIINNLHIDLARYYNNAYYPTYKARYLKGIGVGVFTGVGLNINANRKWNLQLLYSPSYEKINIGHSPKLSIQHNAGITAFYKI